MHNLIKSMGKWLKHFVEASAPLGDTYDHRLDLSINSQTKKAKSSLTDICIRDPKGWLASLPELYSGV